MYNTELVTGAASQITLATPGGPTFTAGLYSREGLEMVAGLWLKLSAEYRLMYEHTWLGVPIIQLGSDIVLMQELLWRLRPDWVVECGLAHGGAAVLYASILELIGKGSVLGVDVEVRPYNRVALKSHPLSRRIEWIESSSISEESVAQVRRRVAGAKTVLVVLDSNHSRQHVLAEMERYHDLVTADSYLVVMDGAQAHVWDVPHGKPEWRDSNPLQAIDQFLAAHPDFESDPYFDRVQVTSSPRGFLRRKAHL